MSVWLALVPTASMGADQPFTVTKIVDSSMAVPGAEHRTFDRSFSPFSDVVLDRSGVAFIGHSESPSSFAGVYVHRSGELEMVVDPSTPVPGTTDNFNLISRLGFEDDVVAFSVQVGVYMEAGGGIEIVADRTTPIPGEASSFWEFGEVVVAAGEVIFGGGHPNSFCCTWHQTGIYRATRARLVTLVDQSTPIPGGNGTFSVIGDVHFDEAGYAFAMPAQSTANDGFYKNIGQGLERVADLNTSIPGGPGSFTSFRSMGYDRGTVAFVGLGEEGWSGVYSDLGGLHPVADRGTLVPGAGVPFEGFSNRLAFSHGRLAFMGFWNPPGPGVSTLGIFAVVGDVLYPVVQAGETLDGKVVARLDLPNHAMHDGHLAVTMEFTDETHGLYVFDLVLFGDGFESGDTSEWSSAAR